MKVCILTGYYFPEITAETHLLLDLANDFIKYGADVTVITTFPSRGIDEPTRQNYLFKSQEITTEGVKIFRVGLKSMESKNFLIRSLQYIYSSLAIYRTAKKIKPNVYLISSTPPFLGIAGAYLTKIAPSVYNLQDIFPDSLISINKGKENSFLIRFLKILEKTVYKVNTHILTVSNDFRSNIRLKGVPEAKISIIYNWIDCDIIRPLRRLENSVMVKYDLKPEGFYITYCGNIGHTQNLEMIIDVAKNMEDNFSDIKFIFIGDGAWLKNILEYIRKKNSNNVLVLPYQPYEEISSVFSLGDVSLVCSKKNVSISSFPSKTWSIMSASRAVLCSFDEESELCSIIKKADCGICVPPENAIELEKAIIFFYMNRERTKQYGINGREYVIKNLSREHGTKEYFNLLKSFVRT